MPLKPLPIPALLFGETSASRHADVRSLGESIEAAFPGLNGYDAQGETGSFFAKSCTLEFPALKVVASAMSPSYVDRDGHQTMTLMVPLAGKCYVKIDGKTFEWGCGLGGMFMPELNGSVQGYGDARSLVLFNIDPQVLLGTARAMMGLDPTEAVCLQADYPRLIPLVAAGKSIVPVLRHLGALIDFNQVDGRVLASLGFESIFYRYLVGLLCPDVLPAADDSSSLMRPSRIGRLDLVCDAMKQDLGKRWALTDLESMSAFSARSLQYAFKKRFGCSPMDWLREERLQYAKRRLYFGDFQTITQLAHECGFSTASQFSAYFKARFGITPTQTWNC